MKYLGKDHFGHKLCINKKIMQQERPLNELHYVYHTELGRYSHTVIKVCTN